MGGRREGELDIERGKERRERTRRRDEKYINEKEQLREGKKRR